MLTEGKGVMASTAGVWGTERKTTEEGRSPALQGSITEEQGQWEGRAMPYERHKWNRQVSKARAQTRGTLAVAISAWKVYKMSSWDISLDFLHSTSQFAVTSRMYSLSKYSICICSSDCALPSTQFLYTPSCHSGCSDTSLKSVSLLSK